MKHAVMEMAAHLCLLCVSRHFCTFSLNVLAVHTYKSSYVGNTAFLNALLHTASQVDQHVLSDLLREHLPVFTGHLAT
jgi:hypothetical protein